MSSRVGMFILEQQRSQVASHVPEHMQGEHAQEDMGPDPCRVVDVEGPNLELAGFELSEGLLDLCQALVRPDGVFGRQVAGVEIGAYDVDAVELGLGIDLPLFAGEREIVVGDGDPEVFLDLAAVGIAPDPPADSVGAA